jgi:hypothetical protein
VAQGVGPEFKPQYLKKKKNSIPLKVLSNNKRKCGTLNLRYSVLRWAEATREASSAPHHFKSSGTVDRWLYIRLQGLGEEAC